MFTNIVAIALLFSSIIPTSLSQPRTPAQQALLVDNNPSALTATEPTKWSMRYCSSTDCTGPNDGKACQNIDGKGPKACWTPPAAMGAVRSLAKPRGPNTTVVLCVYSDDKCMEPRRVPVNFPGCVKANVEGVKSFKLVERGFGGCKP